MEIIKHFSHSDHHQLKLVGSIEGRRGVSKWRLSNISANCNGCYEVMSFPGYACESCWFYLHKSCAELAQEISHPFHHHPLNLLSEIPGSLTRNFDGIICDGCRNLYKKGFTYYCSWCGFNLHPKCASKHDHEELLQQQTFNKELTLYHFCHKHALKFCNLRNSNHKDCCCCKKIIRGLAYCCLECKFFIHESCKEIPKQVQHPFHPQHILLAQAMDEDASMTRCDACKSEIEGIKIGCNMCKFNLHVSCANPNRWACALKHPCHEHNMYYFIVEVIKRRISFFECNKCHEKGLYGKVQGMAFYRCVECDFNLHLKCIIPSVVTVTQKHHHPLTLIDSVREDNPLIQYLMDSNDTVDYSMDYYCDICETPGNPKRHAYCCKKCNYIAHVECIISKKDTPLEIPSNLNPTERQSTGTEPKKEQKMSDEADRNTKQAAQNMSKKNGASTSLDSKNIMDNEELFRHPSHPHHKLILLQQEESSKKIKYCNCCDEVMCFPGYACVYCRFYLHKSCAELASHPLHHHRLNLLSEIPGSRNSNFEGIICDGCRNLYKEGFTYYCSWSCGFNLHPKCASKNDHEELQQQQTFNKELTLYHFCHIHALNFCNLRESHFKRCFCCKKIIRGLAYCCLECGFFIHESCKEIPKQVQHPFHPQHLLLAQPMEVKQHFSSKRWANYLHYKCNACLGPIYGIKIGCIECSFNLHVSCANPNYRALKHKCHMHNMYYFVDDYTTRSFECNKCHEICLEESFYRCVECDFNLHLECIPIPSVVTVTQKHHHPLTLIDSIKEGNPLIQYLMDSNDKVDHSMDYYCDVCETPGNPKHHAYCCKECIYIAHVECIISEECSPRSKDDTEKESDDEAEQHNNTEKEIDIEKEKESNEVQETDTEDEQEIDIEDCSLAQLDERIASVR